MSDFFPGRNSPKQQSFSLCKPTASGKKRLFSECFSLVWPREMRASDLTLAGYSVALPVWKPHFHFKAGFVLKHSGQIFKQGFNTVGDRDSQIEWGAWTWGQLNISLEGAFSSWEGLTVNCHTGLSFQEPNSM